MSTFCLLVKPSSENPGTRVMSVTRLGPEWTGRRLRLRDPERFGLANPDLIGWSDFYAGSACDLHVARATDGTDVGWLIWGGTLGLRAVPADDAGTERRRWEGRPLLWVDDAGVFPDEVRRVVANDANPDSATVTGPGWR